MTTKQTKSNTGTPVQVSVPIICENRFEVDTEGFKNQMSEMKPFRLVYDMIANCFDESSVSNIICKITQNSASTYKVWINDDGEGFLNYKDIFTMYRHSYKRSLPDKRGRFNLGEKQFFAVAIDGTVKTKNWFVKFYENKREIHQVEPIIGTDVIANFSWTKEQVKDILFSLEKLIVPKDKKLVLNGKQIESRNPVKQFNTELYTHLEESGSNKMRSVKRECEVHLYNLLEGETAWLYELGVPVQKLKQNIQWHVDVRQKVPLPTRRDQVSEAYLIDLYASVLNNAYDLVDKEESGSKWINIGMRKANEETARDIFTKQYGTDQVFIPSETDYHANERVNETGGQFIIPRTLDKYDKQHLEEIGVLRYAGKVFRSSPSEYCENVEPTEAMGKYSKVVKLIAKDLIKKEINVFFVKSDSTHPAWFGINSITYNLPYLTGGKKFFEEFSVEGIGLLIHELSHSESPNEQEYPMPHSSAIFLSEMERIGGEIGKVGIDHWIKQSEE